MKRLFIMGGFAVSFLVISLTAGSMLIAQNVQSAKTSWQTAMQKHGFTTEMPAVLQWQLWPLGLKAGSLRLSNQQGETLLETPHVFVGLSISDVFSAQTGVLHLQDATFFYRRHTDGSTNWDNFLKSPDTPPLRGLTLLNAHLEIHSPLSTTAFNISIPALEWQNTEHLLHTDFLISSIDESQNNLLIEGTLQSDVMPYGESSWQFKTAMLETTLSSTRLPGTLVFKSTGDLELQSGSLRSDALDIQAGFKVPGQIQDLTADIRAAFHIDWQKGVIALPSLRTKVGSHEWQLQGDMVANTANRTLQAAQLAVIRNAGGTAAEQRLDISNFSASAKTADGQHQFQLSGRIGEGRLDIPATIRLSADSAAISASVEASRIDLVNFRNWINDSDARGVLTLTAQATAQGRSLRELQDKAEGQLSLSLQDAKLGRISVMPPLLERLQGYATFLPALAKTANAEKGTAIRSLQLQSTLKDGVIITDKFQADIDLARLNATGRYDSRQGLMDYHGKLILDKRLFLASTHFELPIVCQGNLHEEQVDFVGGLETDCNVEEQAKQDLLARALISRFRN
jgi:hypothetical protein